ncbi:GrpB family protein, partial [Halobacteriales archaeon QS_7_68_65]
MVNPSNDPIELTPSRYETWRTRFEDERERGIDA